MNKSRNAAHLKDVITRIEAIANKYAEMDIPDYARSRLCDEIETHRETLEIAFEDRKQHGPALGGADSDTYFQEKLSGLTIFAKMAVDPEQREGYDPQKIKENVGHYAYLVSDLVAADWP